MAEDQYLHLISKILKEGQLTENRTGVKTWTLFGEKMEFDLEHSFPLLTTKKLFWRGIVEELIWMLSGSTNSNDLSGRGIRIWDANGSREFLDKCGFKGRAEGDLGPVYGFQWRHFGAEYIDHVTDYTGQGTDQLKEVIRLIKNDPTSRRIILSAWNPADLSQMVLPPCHAFCQFHVENDENNVPKYLSCQMYQRSADMGLGVPFNIASYALLTNLIAHVCGLKPKRFHYLLGNVHIYENHVEALKEQILRTPLPFPTLKFLVSSDMQIDEFTPEDVELVNYQYHPSIKMDMVA
jgi:thymidylate synthase